MPRTMEALDRTLNLKGRIARDGWVAAAKKLTEGRGGLREVSGEW